jgi:cobyrinic acid a,c-diamide synthase
MVAGTSGDAGKTVVTVGLARALARQGRRVAPFKKGPDYIDAAWLSAAAGEVARNLDTFLADPVVVRRSFMEHAVSDGVNLIEGNRGFHDGMDADGSHSSAALSKLIECPVVLVQDVTKMTRSAAAFVLGSRLLDEGVEIAGVVLNRVAGARHEKVVRSSIEQHCGVPVLGAIPKLSAESRIPLRHLGLVTPGEEKRLSQLVDRYGDVVDENVDLSRLLQIARAAKPMTGTEERRLSAARSGRTVGGTRSGVRICILSDSAFSFYYPENLEALEAAGAELFSLSALDARELPPCDALYVGGGFPETHASALAENSSFRRSLFLAAEAGLPVYAECGGLIYLAESLSWRGKEYPMTGVFPIRIAIDEKPCGHGYTRCVVDGRNPFFEEGTELKGHEFHYSRVVPGKSGLAATDSVFKDSVFEVKRGTGCGESRDGLLRWNVLGTYLHVHALGCPEWARGVVRAAEKNRKE